MQWNEEQTNTRGLIVFGKGRGFPDLKLKLQSQSNRLAAENCSLSHQSVSITTTTTTKKEQHRSSPQ